MYAVLQLPSPIMQRALDIYQKLETRKRSTLVAEQLLTAINSGEYGVGQKLPSEPDLATAMGVSRASVREAISALRVVGILESRPGLGTFVLMIPRAQSLEEATLIELLESTDSPFEVLECRAILDVGAVALAAIRRTDEDLETISAAISKSQVGLKEHDHELMLKANQDFHVGIIKAAKNPLVARIYEALLAGDQRIWKDLVSETFEWSSARPLHEGSSAIHVSILTAIRDRDVESAVEAMQTHYHFMESALGSGEGEDGEQ